MVREVRNNPNMCLCTYDREAWQLLGAMTTIEAMNQYVTQVTNLAPQWKDTSRGGQEGGKGTGGGGGQEGGKGAGGGGGVVGPVVSTLMNNDAEVIPDESKTVFDWCKEGHTTKLSSGVMLSADNVNTLDEQVLC